MTVRSEHLRDGQRVAKESAVFTRSQLRRQRGAIERWTALVILFVSFLGTIVALAGGWEPFLSSLRAYRPPWAAIAGGIGIQALLTFLEWHYFDRRFVSIPARVVDTVFTALGYGPLVLSLLSAALVERHVSEPIYVAWLIIGVVSYVIAWYPESRLID